MAVKDWRVFYGSYDGVDNHTRSRPFTAEDQALAWAITWVKTQDQKIWPMAHVVHRSEVSHDGERLDPVPRSHKILWAMLNGEPRLIKRTWPSVSRAARAAEVQRAMSGIGLAGLGKSESEKPKVYTEVEIVDEMPLRAL